MHPRVVYTPGSLTDTPEKYTGPQKEKRGQLVFQASFFQGELLNFGRVCIYIYNINIYIPSGKLT